MHAHLVRRFAPVLVLPLLVATTACDLMMADSRVEETSEWHKTYQLDPSGKVQISDINGKIQVEPSDGNTVDVRAVKKARGASSDAAKAALNRISIVEDTGGDHVTLTTKVDTSSGGLFSGGNLQVEYHVKVPAGADVRFVTTNGGIDVTGLKGHVYTETTNGGIAAHDIAGPIEASTTNGGVVVDLTQVAEPGVKLSCTNGGIKLRLPHDAKATISARVANGGIDTNDLPLKMPEGSRRRLDGALNGGGPHVDIETTNGGISIAGR